MSSATYFVLESENPEGVVTTLREIFDSDEVGEILDSDKVVIDREFSENMPERKGWSKLFDDVSRILGIYWTDTGGVVSGKLYSLNEEVELIDEEKARLYSDRNIDRDGGSPYQGFSYLPAYFFHKHDFKTFDKYPYVYQKLDFDNLYDPRDTSENYFCEMCQTRDHSHSPYICPVCKNEDVEKSGWKTSCKNCDYEESTPKFKIRFEGHSALTTFGQDKPRDISKEDSKQCIIQINDDRLCKIEETTLVDAIKRYDSFYNSDFYSLKQNLIEKYGKVENWSSKNIEIKTNDKKVKDISNYRLEGSKPPYNKYEIEIKEKHLYKTTALEKLKQTKNRLIGKIRIFRIKLSIWN